MKETLKTLEEYKPYFGLSKIGEILYYERAWFCEENKIIHNSEKEVIKCVHCFFGEKD